MEAYFKTSNKSIDLRLIIAYAPTNEAEDNVKDNFYDQLESVFKNGHKEKNVTMLLGDLNAKVGKIKKNIVGVMG